MAYLSRSAAVPLSARNKILSLRNYPRNGNGRGSSEALCLNYHILWRPGIQITSFRSGASISLGGFRRHGLPFQTLGLAQNHPREKIKVELANQFEESFVALWTTLIPHSSRCSSRGWKLLLLKTRPIVSPFRFSKTIELLIAHPCHWLVTPSGRQRSWVTWVGPTNALGFSSWE